MKIDMSKNVSMHACLFNHVFASVMQSGKAASFLIKEVMMFCMTSRSVRVCSVEFILLSVWYQIIF